MKRCCNCGQNKTVASFYHNRSRFDGLCSRCIDCEKIKNKIYRLKYPEYFKEKYNDFLKRNPGYRILKYNEWLKKGNNHEKQLLYFRERNRQRRRHYTL